MMVKCFWNNFIAALAALSSVATLVAFIYKWENNLTTCETIIGFLTEKANFLVFFLRKITILWGWVFLAMARCQ